MSDTPRLPPVGDAHAMSGALGEAFEQARLGLRERGVPIGAVLVDATGSVIGAGRNGTVQFDDHLLHAETAAVRSAGRLADYASMTLVTTMTPCWYCAGLVRFLGIGSVVIGDGRSWSTDAADWLAEAGVNVSVLDDEACIELFTSWIATDPAAWALPDSVDGEVGRA